MNNNNSNNNNSNEYVRSLNLDRFGPHANFSDKRNISWAKMPPGVPPPPLRLGDIALRPMTRLQPIHTPTRATSTVTLPTYTLTATSNGPSTVPSTVPPSLFASIPPPTRKAPPPPLSGRAAALPVFFSPGRAAHPTDILFQSTAPTGTGKRRERKRHRKSVKRTLKNKRK